MSKTAQHKTACKDNNSHVVQIKHQKSTRAPAATDRPTRHRGSVHAKYSVSHHMVIKPFLLLGLAAEYRSRRWLWSTVVWRPSKVYETLTGEL